MAARRENLLETIKPGGRPDRPANCCTACRPTGGGSVFQYVRGSRMRGANFYDR